MWVILLIDMICAVLVIFTARIHNLSSVPTKCITTEFEFQSVKQTDLHVRDYFNSRTPLQALHRHNATQLILCAYLTVAISSM